MSSAVRRVKLMAIVVLGFVVAGCSGGPIGGLTDATITITGQFANANGLYVGNAVSVLGMRVGKVVDIQARATHVDVTMKIDKSIKIPADALAVTVTDSMLTDRHVELTPVYRGGSILADHTTLTTDRTRTPVEFDSLLAMADKLSTSLGGNGQGQGPVAGLLDIGSQIVTGNGNSLRDAMTALSRALQLGPDNGAATRAAVTTVVQNLDALASAAARNDQALREFGSGIRMLSDILANLNLGTGDTGAKLNQITIQMTDLLERNQDKLRALSTNAGTITKSMADYNGNLAEFLDVFPLVTDNAYNAIDQNIGALRAGIDLNKFLLDGQMVKEVCNLLGAQDLGCATGTLQDKAPDFGLRQMLELIAKAQPK